MPIGDKKVQMVENGNGGGDRYSGEPAPKRRKLNDDAMPEPYQEAYTSLQDLLKGLAEIKEIDEKSEGREVGYVRTEEENNLWLSIKAKAIEYLQSQAFRNPLVELATSDLPPKELRRNLALLIKIDVDIASMVINKSSYEHPNPVHEMIFYIDKFGEVITKNHQVLFILSEILKEEYGVGKQALEGYIVQQPSKILLKTSAFQHAIDSGNKELVQFCLENGIGVKARFLVQGKELSLFEYLYETKNLEMAVVAVNSLRTNLSASDRIEILKLKKRMAKRHESGQLAWVFNDEMEQELLKRVQNWNTKDFLELCDEDFLYSLSWDVWQSYIDDKIILKPIEILEILKKFEVLVNSNSTNELKEILKNLHINHGDSTKVEEIFKQLEKFLKKNNENKIYVHFRLLTKKMNLLHASSYFGKKEIVKALLEAGANPNQPDNNGFTPLYIACQIGHIDVVKELLESDKVDPNQPNMNGGTPLFIACNKGHQAIVDLLFNNKKINLKAQAKNGSEALQFAAHGGNVGVINKLIAKRIFDVHYINKANENALFFASQSGNIDAVRIFTKLGLNPTLLNDKGENFIMAMLDNVIKNVKSNEERPKYEAVKKEIEAYIFRYNEVKSKLTTDYARHLPEEMQQSLMLMQSSSSTSLSSSSQAQEDAVAREKTLEAATAHVLKELDKAKKPVLRVNYTPERS